MISAVRTPVGAGLARALGTAAVLTMLACSFSPDRASGATWINPAGGLWTQGSNWDVGHAPTNVEDAVLPDLGPSYTVILDQQAYLRSLSIGTDVRLRMGTDLSIHLIQCSQSFTNGGEIFDAGHWIRAGTAHNLATGRIIVRDGESLELPSILVNDGSIVVSSSSLGDQTAIEISFDVHVSGSGEIVLAGGVVRNAWQESGDLIQEAGHTLRGSGGVIASFVNHGIVNADGGELSVKVTDNDGGVLRVTGGQLAGQVVNADGTIEIVSGTLTADVVNSGGEIRLSGSSGIIAGGIDNQNGQLVSEGTLALSGGVIITGGDLSGPGDFTIGSGVNLKQVVLGPDATLHVTGASRMETSFHHDGTVRIASTVAALNDLVLSGAGAFVLEGGTLLGPGRWINVAGHAITGAGTIAGTLVNQGIVAADGSFLPALRITGTVTNTGRLSAASGVLSVDGAVVGNSGGTIASDGHQVWIENDASVQDGMIVAAAADVVLRATRSRITRSRLERTGSAVFTHAHDALLTDVVLATGAELASYGTLTLYGSITNGGLLRILGTVVVAGGAFLAGDGVVALEGGVLRSDFNRVENLTGHTLRGHGTVAPKLVNAGVLQPGASPGTLRIDGDFDQGSGGRLEIELGGTSAGQFDRLEVEGHSALDGTFALSVIDGYAPAEGDGFEVITFATRSGDFSSYEGLALPGGAQALPIFSPGALHLRIEEGALPVPGPSLPASIRFHAPRAGRGELVLELPNASEVSWALFDVSGRRVGGESRSLEAGVHRFDSGATTSGIYFARAVIRSDRAVESRSTRLIIAR